MPHASCVWHCGHNCIRLMVHAVIVEHVGILSCIWNLLIQILGSVVHVLVVVC